jgi:hypothetical protein
MFDLSGSWSKLVDKLTGWVEAFVVMLLGGERIDAMTLRVVPEAGQP